MCQVLRGTLNKMSGGEGSSSTPPTPISSSAMPPISPFGGGIRLVENNFSSSQQNQNICVCSHIQASCDQWWWWKVMFVVHNKSVSSFDIVCLDGFINRSWGSTSQLQNVAVFLISAWGLYNFVDSTVNTQHSHSRQNSRPVCTDPINICDLLHKVKNHVDITQIN